MSDFFIDFGIPPNRKLSRAAELMRYYDDTYIQVDEYPAFSIVVSRPDDPNVWGPCRFTQSKLFVALAGRVAFERADWEHAATMDAAGGLACRLIGERYSREGIDSLSSLNGSFAVFLFDAEISKAFLITDRCGMVPCFAYGLGSREPVLASHPDVLAGAVEVAQEWDMTSLAEFLMTGRVTFPNTYYRPIRALDTGSIHEFHLNQEEVSFISARKYFDFSFSTDHGLTEWDVAEELGSAFRKAVSRRSHRLFGQTGVSLSGGLDSRAILCASDNTSELWAFCFFDEENLEFRTAADIALAAEVAFLPFKRRFDHYGESAEMGTRISGGLGDFGSNHYLGFRDAFRERGIDNILTGFYCDYLFKALVMEKDTNRFLRKESLGHFRYDRYMPIYWFNSPEANNVRDRLDNLFPENLRSSRAPEDILELERRRFMPLYYEPDSQETAVPQRVMGWYLPTVDNDIIDVYLRIPPAMKLNTSMYSKMVEALCGKAISAIPNINTGARVNAQWHEVFLARYTKLAKKILRGKRTGIATEVSWPNWEYYMHNSRKIRELWNPASAPIVRDVLTFLMGTDPFDRSIATYKSGIDLKLLLRMITLKLWICQRLR